MEEDFVYYNNNVLDMVIVEDNMLQMNIQLQNNVILENEGE